MTPTPHKIGVIGLGAIGRVTLASMTAHRDFEVVCAWDPDPVTRACVREAHPDVEIAEGAEAVIESPETSAVYIASPPLTHVPYVRAVTEAGKCILCEKPLGIDIAESEKLVDLVAQRRLPNVINFNHGNASASRHVEDELASGGMGSVPLIDIKIHLSKWPRDFQAHAAWLAGREQGGFTREMISHWVYLTRRLLGDGVVLYSKASFPNDPGKSETRLLAELEFGGVPTVINAGCGGAGPIGTEYTVWGTGKSYRLHSGGRISSTQGEGWQEEFADVADIGQSDIMRNLDATAKAFRRETVKIATLADGLAVQRIVEALTA